MRFSGETGARGFLAGLGREVLWWELGMWISGRSGAQGFLSLLGREVF